MPRRLALQLSGRIPVALLRDPYNGQFLPDPNARHLTAEGYVKIKDPKYPNGRRYCLEHRVVMEMLIGRPINDSEVVHHHDADRSNNIPENLELQTPSLHRLHHLSKDRHDRTVDGVEHRVCFVCARRSPVSVMRQRQGTFVHAECIKQYARDRARLFSEQHPHYHRDYKRRQREDPEFRARERETKRRFYARKRLADGTAA